jgi:hypothetical protein
MPKSSARPVPIHTAYDDLALEISRADHGAEHLHTRLTPLAEKPDTPGAANELYVAALVADVLRQRLEAVRAKAAARWTAGGAR